MRNTCRQPSLVDPTLPKQLQEIRRLVATATRPAAENDIARAATSARGHHVAGANANPSAQMNSVATSVGAASLVKAGVRPSCSIVAREPSGALAFDSAAHRNMVIRTSCAAVATDAVAVAIIRHVLISVSASASSMYSFHLCTCVKGFTEASKGDGEVQPFVLLTRLSVKTDTPGKSGQQSVGSGVPGSVGRGHG